MINLVNTWYKEFLSFSLLKTIVSYRETKRVLRNQLSVDDLKKLTLKDGGRIEEGIEMLTNDNWLSLNKEQYGLSQSLEGLLFFKSLNTLLETKQSALGTKEGVELIEQIVKSNKALTNQFELEGIIYCPLFHYLSEMKESASTRFIKAIKNKEIRNLLKKRNFFADGKWTKEGIEILEIFRKTSRIDLIEEIIPVFLRKTSNSKKEILIGKLLSNIDSNAEAGYFHQNKTSQDLAEDSFLPAILFRDLEKRPYGLRRSQASDLPILTKLETLCWPAGLEINGDKLLNRISRFPDGQWVAVFEGKVVAALYSQRIENPEALKSADMDMVEELYNSKGDTVQLLAVNVNPNVQDIQIGGGLLEFVLQRVSLVKGIERVVGVTRCRSYQKHASLPYDDYVKLRNENGALFDPVLRYHELHGASIVQPLANYRVRDPENDGFGVLVSYDIYKRERKDFKLNSDHQVPGKPIDELVEDTIQKLLGDSFEDQFEMDSPLMEIGLDSSDLMVLRETLETALDEKISASFFFENSTAELVIEALADKVPVEDKIETEVDSEEEPTSQDYAADDIAIVAYSFKFPEAETPEELWDLLINKKSAISDLPEGRFQWPTWIDTETTHKGIDKGGYIRGIDEFDAPFFRISPAEAELMDPQQRILLQLCWETIERAQIKPSAIKGSRTGVFIGASGSDYEISMREKTSKQTLTGTGTALAILPNRISYFFDLDGPSLQIDTACSSSLVAVHEAVKSLNSGECTSAFVGAVNLICHPHKNLSYHKSGMLSIDGKCKTFDDLANGYVRGEGAAILWLKPIKQAIEDGNEIKGIIKGTAINHGGQAGGLTVPNPGKQRQLVENAFQKAAVDIHSVTYMEAHGTGTPLGDPIELDGLKNAFNSLKKKEFKNDSCGVGSIKTNIGHLEAAAGMAGIIKLLLSMEKKQLAPTNNFKTLNSKIDLSDSPFYIQDELADWNPVNKKGSLIAGVSSFGIGGANGHVILESFIHNESKKSIPKSNSYLFTLSAKNEKALQRYVSKYLTYLGKNGNVVPAELCYALQLQREAMDWRLAINFTNMSDLVEQLKQYSNNISETSTWSANIRKSKDTASKQEVKVFIKNKDLVNLGKNWVTGSIIDWNQLYADQYAVKLEIPTYPFEQKGYWFNSYHDSNEATIQPAKRTATAYKPYWQNLPADKKNLNWSNTVSVEKYSDGVALVTMHDRDSQNMFTDQLINDMHIALGDIRNDQSVKVVVVTGYEKIFCMGGSEELLFDIANKKKRFTDIPFLFRGLLDFDLPVITAIQGHAFGGGLLFGLYGDIVVLSDQGTYSANFMKYGFTPGMGATHILGQKFGKQIATEMMLSAKMVSGKEIKRRGASILVTDDVLGEAMHQARQMCSKPRNSLSILKRKLSMDVWLELERHIQLEEEMHDKTFHTQEVKDHIEKHFGSKTTEQVQNQPVEIIKTTLGKVKLSAVSDESSIVQKSDRKLEKVILSLVSKDYLKDKQSSIASVESVKIYSRQAVVEKLQSIFEQILHIPAQDLDEEAVFIDLGVDSISGVEIIREVNDLFKINLEAVVLYDYHTMLLLSDLILKEIPDSKSVNETVVSEINRVVNDSNNQVINSSNNNAHLSKTDAEIVDQLKLIFERILHIPAIDLDEEAVFIELGVDSISGVEIIREVNEYFRTDLEAVVLYDCHTMNLLAGLIKQEAGVDSITVFNNTAAVTIQEIKPHQDSENKDIIAVLKNTFEGILHIPAEELDEEVSFIELGVDSISGVEIIREVNEHFKIDLEAVVMYDYHTMELLAGLISKTSGLVAIPKSEIARKTVSQVTQTEEDHSKSATSNGEIENILKSIFEKILHIPADEIDVEAVFIELGVDSISGVEIIREVNEAFRLHLEAVVLYDYHSIGQLTELILKESGGLIANKTIPNQQIATFIPNQPVETHTNRTPIISKSPVEELTAEKKPILKTDIAIIGMSGRFPDAKDVDQFWENLKNGVFSGREVPSRKWSVERYFSEDIEEEGKSSSRYLASLDDEDKFDPKFFNISPLEAEKMDPQQRLFIQECWKTIEDAGYNPDDLSGKKCGVFVGVGQSEYQDFFGTKYLDSQVFTGNNSAILSGRVSYYLNLQGPSFSVDTACSSSLVALNQACESIQNGTSELALAGGVYVMTSEKMHVMTSKAGMLNKNGQCRTFDQDADGFLPGEAVGVILLKPLAAAERDGDNIHAVIKGIGVNQDGKTNGITAPSFESQTRLEKEVYKNAGINPESIGLVEAHGTGTKLGDPIEVKALKNAFAEFTNQTNFCALGSVKSNIGHTLMAAGIAGIIKAILSLKNRMLPPTINYSRLNEHISLDNSPFFVNDQLKPWSHHSSNPRRATVSSFGFSGTNAHAVLEEYVDLRKSIKSEGVKIFTLSAKNGERLNESVSNFLRYLENNQNVDLTRLAYTSQIGRQAMEERLVFLASTSDDLIDQFRIYLTGNSSTFIRGNSKTNKGAPYSGLVSDYKNIAQHWVNGGRFDWHSLYGSDKPLRLSLPTYPFARERYWVDVKTETIQINSAEKIQEEFKSQLYTIDWQQTPISAANSQYEKQVILLAGASDEEKKSLRFSGNQIVEIISADEPISSFEEVYHRVKNAILQNQKTHFTVVIENKRFLDFGFVAGVFKTIVHECDHVRGKVLGIASFTDVTLSQILTDEISSEDIEVKYENGSRLVRRLQPIQKSDSAISTVKNDGVYLITGGAGGLGKLLAKHIKDKYQSTIITCGRRSIDQMSDKIGLSADQYYSCDITDFDDTKKMIAAIKARFGKIDGVIHAAGIAKDTLMVNKDRSEYLSILNPKVKGTQNLDEACKDAKLDFFALFSSVASITSNLGQTDYASANNFLDYFAEKRNALVQQGLRNGNTVSVSWPLWQDGGMQISKESEQYLFDKWGLMPLPTSLGINVFEEILSGKNAHFFIAYGDIQKFNSKTLEKSGIIQNSNKSKQEITHDQVTVLMKELVSDLLKLRINEIPVDESFGNLGFDSITLKKLSGVLLKKFDIDVTPMVFYNYPSIQDFSEFLLEDYQNELEGAIETETEEESFQKVSQYDQMAHSPIAYQQNGSSKKPDGQINKNEPVAIIGMSGRFPQSPDLDTFWENLEENKDLITEIPKDRWDWEKYYGDSSVDSMKTKAKWGGFINDVDKFDPLFFNLSPREAEAMDPQHRIALEAVFHALEDAGITAQEIAGTNTGIFMGTYLDDYSTIINEAGQFKEAQTLAGLSQSMLTNRISYLLNIHGPSEPVDTACSSSLVAIHRAVDHIRKGACDMVMAGGVSLDLKPYLYLTLSQAGMLSEDGRCKTFDESANGYVRGEGVGVIVLKSLSTALADGDRIYGVIKGTAQNHGGKANTLTSPNPNAQKELLVEAYVDAGVDPRHVTYIETHGTGTPLGDPIETEGLKSAFATLYKKHSLTNPVTPHCALGSVKTNVGHLEPAAGIVGVIKVLLAMRHGKIPGNPQLKNPNQYLKLDNSPFYLQQQTSEWQTPAGVPMIAGVSSFGFGGTNAHVVLESYPSREIERSAVNEKSVFILSAKNKDRLKEYAKNVASYLEKHPALNIVDVAYTSQIGRSEMDERLAMVCSDIQELTNQLKAFADGNTQGTIHANITQNKTSFSIEGEAGKAYLKSAIETKELSSVAQLWSQGISIDWNLLYQSGRKPHKTSLPGYPFARESYWIAEGEQSGFSREAISQLHPLLHENISDFYGQKFQSVFTGNESFLLDHIIRGYKILPGVSYLEMVREAGERSSGIPVSQLNNITWVEPIIIEDDSKMVSVEIKPIKDGDMSYQVYSTKDDEKIIHGEGELKTDKRTSNESINLAEIQESLTKSIEGSVFYEQLDQIGFSYGSSFRGVKNVEFNENEALAEISLEANEKYTLLPGLIDSILHPCMLLTSEPDQVLLPYHIGAVTLYADIQGNIRSYVRKLPNDQVAKGLASFDITIADESGKVLATIADFIAMPEKLNRSKAIARTYQVDWKETTSINQVRTDEQLILIPNVESGLINSLKQTLNTDVISITSADKDTFLVKIIDQVKNLSLSKQKADITLLYQNEARLDFAFVSGLFKTMNLENPRLSGKIIGVENLKESTISQVLEAEKYSTDPDIRYLGGKREKLEAQIITIAQTDQNSVFKPEGVYLVTGGAGAIGRSIVNRILEVRNTKVIATGRRKTSTFDSQVSERLIYRSCDISDRDQVLKLVQEIKSEYGEINGVIHAAGVVNDDFIINKTEQQIREVIKPKIDGTIYLDEATKEEPLDFFALMSSLSGYLGNIGQGDYASANSFMDDFARNRNLAVASGFRKGLSVSLDWSLWKEGGMQIDAASEKFLADNWGITPFPTKEAIDSMNTILQNGDAGQFLVTFGAKELPLKKQILETPVQNSADNSLASVSGDWQIQAAEYIRSLLAEELHLPAERLQENVPFENYGIDSILINKITNKLDSVFGRLPRTLFFEYQTLGELNEYFIEDHADTLKVKFSEALKEEKPVIREVQEVRFTPRPVHEIIKPDQSAYQNEEIAIIGLSGRYPGAENIDQFWDNLKNGKDSITEIPSDRWDVEALFDPEVGKSGKIYSKWGGFINDVDKFDPVFFKISPREAEILDPQERLFLQTAWSAIEDGGYTRESLHQDKTKEDLGGKVGVFVGVMYEEYQLFGAEQTLLGNPTALWGSPSSIANRVSYFFDLHGPSLAIDTMCSSSITAIHLACESLRNGESNYAIAGGVNVSIHPNKYIMLSNGKFISAKGRCESFGEGGEGYIPGEGVGAVLLKPLSKAKADGDHIYGVIKGTSVNHGGKTNGYTVPNPKAQAAVIKSAISKAGVKPEDFSYIEAHGTGTSLGDPIEIAGLSKAFNSDKKQFCAIGSVKSNIGHGESAAGISGVTKVLLQLKHRKLVPSLHSSALNPHIDFANSPFKVQQTLEDWKIAQGKSRIAGLSSFGAGGSNAHIIIEEYIESTPQQKGIDHSALILLSAKNKDRLQEQVRNLSDHISANDQLAIHDIAYTLISGREHMAERLAFVVNDLHDLTQKISDYASGSNEGFVQDNIKQYYEESQENELLKVKAISQYESEGLLAIAEEWSKGKNIDWNDLYITDQARRISLPTYPFLKKRFWFDGNKSIKPVQAKANGKATKAKAVAQQPNLEIVREKVVSIERTSLGKVKLDVPDKAHALLKKPDNSFKLPMVHLSAISEENLFQKSEPIAETLILTQESPKAVVSDVSKIDLTEDLKSSLAKVLYLEINEIDEHEKFIDLGLDSVVGVEWVSLINQKFTVDLQATRLYDFPTISLLANYINGELFRDSGNQQFDETFKSPKTQSIQNQQVSNGISDQLIELLSAALYLEKEEIDVNEKFIDLGLDSVIGVEWVSAINQKFDIELNATRLYDFPTVATLSGHIAEFVCNNSFDNSKPVVDEQTDDNHQAEISSGFILESLRESLSNVLYLDISEIDDHEKFVDLGLDSVVGVEWVSHINETFKVNLEATRLYDFPTVKLLSGYLLDLVGEQTFVTSILVTESAVTEADEEKATIDESSIRPKLISLLANVLYLEENEIDDYEKFIDLGLDSVVGVEWVSNINETFGLKIEATRLYDYPTIKELTKFIGTQLSELVPTNGKLTNGSDLSEEEKLRELLEKVASGKISADDADNLLLESLNPN